MQLQAVVCASCGAPLRVPNAARFVTCHHCESTLEIKHTEDVTYSEKISQIDVRTERIEAKLEVIRLERELEACDAEWDRKKGDYLTVNARGEKVAPSLLSVLVPSSVCLAAAFFLFLGGSEPFDVGFAFFGVVAVLMACWFGVVGVVQIKHYQEAESQYLGRRFRLVSQLEQARNSAGGE